MKSFILPISILILCNISGYLFAPQEDLVVGLFDDIYKHPLYSGYLNTNDANRKLHYLFAPSQNNTDSDPVVLWLNGGPGCSSLLGFLQEHGPVIIQDFATNFTVNDYSWNKFASILYIESPAGVGFSYSDNLNDLGSNDTKSGIDNEQAILSFFTKFPELKKNPFYLSGESYAGVYVPILANLLLKDAGINLKGIIVGNGLTDITVDVEEALVDFAYEHALYSQETRDKYIKLCSKKSNDFNPTNVTAACNDVRRDIKASLDGNNIYDIYRQCKPSTSGSSKNYQETITQTLKKYSLIKNYGPNYAAINFNDVLEPEVGIWPEGCGDDPYPTEFLNLNATQTALHVRPMKWEQCSGDVGGNYTLGTASLQTYITSLIPSALNIWFYSGDTDAAVPFNGSIKWIPKLNLNITEEYRSWSVDNQTAGFVEVYNRLTFVTIKGTGHMAPQWKRKESYIMFNAFLTGTKLPM